MRKIKEGLEWAIFFNPDYQWNRKCFGNHYFRLIDYAYQTSDFFMLVYVSQKGRSFRRTMQKTYDAFLPFLIKQRVDTRWPGTLLEMDPKHTFLVAFYRNDEAAMELLKSVRGLFSWNGIEHPRDLAFFRGNQCWLLSQTTKKIAGLIHADDDDVRFVKNEKLARSMEAFFIHPKAFSEFDEILVDYPTENRA